MTLIIKELVIREGYNGFTVFENGDGTCYSIIVVEDPYGGYNFYVNNESAYRVYENDFEVKFLFGKNNKFTKLAVSQIARSLI
jgi:hypothetical protein